MAVVLALLFALIWVVLRVIEVRLCKRKAHLGIVWVVLVVFDRAKLFEHFFETGLGLFAFTLAPFVGTD